MKSTLGFIFITPAVSGVALARYAHEHHLISASGWQQTLMVTGLCYAFVLLLGGVWR